MASEQEILMRETILRTQITATLGQMSESEMLIIHKICCRVNRARELYGRLELATDRRDWGRELYEEQLDAMFYAAAGAVSCGAAVRG